MLTDKDKALLRSGFTPDDVKKLKNAAANYGDPIESVIDVLSRRFRGMLYITIVLLIIWVLIIAFDSQTSALSFGIAFIFVLGIFTLVIPLKLGYKAWRYQRRPRVSFDRQ
ncbi:hypothetical protein [Brenneria tiliae]|nr:hypothetical protein [Brenneria tiliae]MCL2897000.1 hypothetical protein [Brenneria tiliae]MCL2901605.1 hypothetical protein [Brenneria tiliae]